MELGAKATIIPRRFRVHLETGKQADDMAWRDNVAMLERCLYVAMLERQLELPQLSLCRHQTASPAFVRPCQLEPCQMVVLNPVFSPAYPAGFSFQTAGVKWFFWLAGVFRQKKTHKMSCLQSKMSMIKMSCSKCHEQNVNDQWQHLQQLADIVGKSKWVEIPGKCQACVCYHTFEETQTAIANLNGGVLFDVWKNA